MNQIDIGTRIKQARSDAKMTQEAAADKLGVSRQTISNWENSKTYPDIISVIKMSDLYSISLDSLLKEEKNMSNNYLDYLEESTNVVKSNRNKSILTLIISYLLIYAFALIVFYFFTSGSDAMGYSIMYLWVLLPVTILIVSAIIGYHKYFGEYRLVAPVVLGITYMLAEYGTFSAVNMITFMKWNAPEYTMILVGMTISFIGLLIGSTLKKMNQKKKAK